MTKTLLDPTFDIPAGLSAKGRKAAQIMLKWASKQYRPSTGGCKAFYTPKEWEARGEQYGTKSHLILVHDGGIFSDYNDYNMDCDGGWIEATRKELEAIGLYVEPCTCWYVAFYEI